MVFILFLIQAQGKPLRFNCYARVHSVMHSESFNVWDSQMFKPETLSSLANRAIAHVDKSLK